MFLQHTINGILMIIEGLKAAAACDAGKVNLTMSQMLSTNTQPAKHVIEFSQILLRAVHACSRAGVGPGKKVAILGAGPIGNCCPFFLFSPLNDR